MKATSLAALLLFALVAPLSACDKKSEENAGQSTTNAADTTAEASAEPPDRKGPPTYVIGFEPQEDRDKTLAKAEKLAEFITSESGIRVGVYVPKESGDLVEAIQDKDAHIAYLSAWPFVAAHLNADAHLLLAEERDGKTTYETTFYVAKDSDIATTKDLKGKRVAFTTPTSTSGYLYPMMKLIEDGVVERDEDLGAFAKEVVFAGGYDEALKALAAGKVDVAAVASYAPELYLTAEERAMIKPIASHGPIPTHVIAVRADTKMDDQKKLMAAFLALNKDENRALLKDVYGAEKLVERSHGDHVYGLQEKLQELNVDYPIDD